MADSGPSLAPPPHAHPVDVKVLRLSKPSLVLADAVDSPPLPTGELSVPKVTGSVCVGEKFVCLISVSNRVHEDIKVQLTTEVLTPTQQRARTAQSHDARKTLAPGETLDVTTSFEPSQVGGHALVLHISYETTTETRSIRKTFKFESLMALNTRVRTMSTSKGPSIVEVQIENILDTTLIINACDLKAVGGWSIKGVADPLPVPILRPRDVFQYCFVANGGESRELGNLSVKWAREPLGIEGFSPLGVVRL
ncbi:Trafficking protein particle complex subunit 13 [Wickerhamiella sorbophila]|uniref:Trafficking protein particle complex subunit 13 n=1 Tax=Wickerhamiella sorbophila TaxID=45607 RepID=A0A2T0FLB3_9ASCO|nr:Trafficking protein particle complex subunit 13 [Wickerhamiella sorbophila]PRT55776.1 Trafficking protein particle complex subunit 13 [Wickerhamiella sorbophila]